MKCSTEVELEIIPDPSTYIFFEKGTGGGVSYTSFTHSKAKISI